MRTTSQRFVIKKKIKIIIKSIIKWKEHGTITILPIEGRPPELMDWRRRALIRDAAQRPKVTLKELQSSTAENGVSVPRSWALWESDQKKSHYLKIIGKNILSLPEDVGNSPDVWRQVLW